MRHHNSAPRTPSCKRGGGQAPARMRPLLLPVQQNDRANHKTSTDHAVRSASRTDDAATPHATPNLRAEPGNGAHSIAPCVAHRPVQSPAKPPKAMSQDPPKFQERNMPSTSQCAKMETLVKHTRQPWKKGLEMSTDMGWRSRGGRSTRKWLFSHTDVSVSVFETCLFRRGLRWQWGFGAVATGRLARTT